MDIVQCIVLFISQKTVWVEWVCMCTHTANLTCVYLTCIWTCVVVSVIIVACSLFLSMCLFVLVNCIVVMKCVTLVGVSVLLII